MLRLPSLIRIITLLLLCGVGCVTTPRKSTTDEEQAKADSEKVADKKQSPGTPGPDEDVLAIDTNGDNKSDVYKYYPKGKVPTDSSKPDTGGPIIRAERDLNGDGKIDVWTWFNPDGSKLRESFDLDFDSKVDLTIFYEKNIVVRKEYFTGGHDKPDVFKYYDKGKLIRVERDRKGAGKIDTWEYWDGDQIDRIGEDTDGDGTVDRWIKPPKKS